MMKEHPTEPQLLAVCELIQPDYQWLSQTQKEAVRFAVREHWKAIYKVLKTR